MDETSYEAEFDEERQRIFYDQIREWIISLLAVVLLYLVSYWTVARYKKSRLKEECYSGEEDALVYRISTWLCSFSLCVSVGAVLLLPTSILTNEILHYHPHNQYLRWINTSLIRGLWNQVFMGCNISLFLLLPFAYFFIESEGLAGWRKGIMSRVYETVILMTLLALMALGVSWLLSSFFSSLSLDYQPTEAMWWFTPFPLLYSLVSMFGVLLMGVCTPIGISCLFSVLGHLITKPKLHGVVEEELEGVKLEEAAILRRRKLGMVRGGGLQLNNGTSALTDVLKKKAELERHVRSSQWERRLAYPLSFLLLLSISLLVLIMVALNLFSLVFLGEDSPALPSSRGAEWLLGETSVSHLGPIGATLQIIIIVYVVCASVVGLYSTPLLRNLLPLHHDTSMTKLIGNCILLLVLSSALPLLTRTLGLTRFNLFGRFSHLEWVGGGWWAVLLYNGGFFSLTLLILFRQLTSAVLREVTALLRPRPLSYLTLKGFGKARHPHQHQD